uniref:Uncharacterized protein n=1 Tax=Rhizophora mucronata TaxID=61149 RepID=A0A2P2NAQ8_RHIMU
MLQGGGEIKSKWMAKGEVGYNLIWLEIFG